MYRHPFRIAEGLAGNGGPLSVGRISIRTYRQLRQLPMLPGGIDTATATSSASTWAARLLLPNADIHPDHSRPFDGDPHEGERSRRLTSRLHRPSPSMNIRPRHRDDDAALQRTITP
jgi:hypothetical protein